MVLVACQLSHTSNTNSATNLSIVADITIPLSQQETQDADRQTRLLRNDRDIFYRDCSSFQNFGWKYLNVIKSERRRFFYCYARHHLKLVIGLLKLKNGVSVSAARARQDPKSQQSYTLF